MTRNMSNIIKAAIGTVLFAGLAAGCGGGAGAGTTVVAANSGAVSAPRILSTTPRDGAENVDSTSAVAATFNMPMDMDSVQSGMHLYQGDPGNGHMVSGSFAPNDSHTGMTFTPDAPLSPGAMYTLHFSSGMMGAADGHMMSGTGHRMDSETMISFMTRPREALQ